MLVIASAFFCPQGAFALFNAALVILWITKMIFDAKESLYD